MEKDRAECLWNKVQTGFDEAMFPDLSPSPCCKAPTQSQAVDAEDAAAQSRAGQVMREGQAWWIQSFQSQLSTSEEHAALGHMAGQMAQWARAFAFKYEDLSSNPKHSCQKLGMAVCAPKPRETQSGYRRILEPQGAADLDEGQASGSMGDPVSGE